MLHPIPTKQDHSLHSSHTLYPKRCLSDNYLTNDSIRKVQKFRKLDSSLNTPQVFSKDKEGDSHSSSGTLPSNLNMLRTSSLKLENSTAGSVPSFSVYPEPIQKYFDNRSAGSTIEEAIRNLKVPTQKVYKKQLEKMRMLIFSQERRLQNWMMVLKKDPSLIATNTSPTDDTSPLSEALSHQTSSSQDHLSSNVLPSNRDSISHNHEGIQPLRVNSLIDINTTASPLSQSENERRICYQSQTDATSQSNHLGGINLNCQVPTESQINPIETPLFTQKNPQLSRDASLTSLQQNQTSEHNSVQTTNNIQQLQQIPYASRSISEPVAFDPQRQQQYRKYLQDHQQWLRQRQSNSSKPILPSNLTQTSNKNILGAPSLDKNTSSVPIAPIAHVKHHQNLANNQMQYIQGLVKTSKVSKGPYNSQAYSHQQINNQGLPPSNLTRSQSAYTNPMNPQAWSMNYHRALQYKLALQNRAVLQSRMNGTMNSQQSLPYQMAHQNTQENAPDQRGSLHNLEKELISTEAVKTGQQGKSFAPLTPEQWQSNNMTNVKPEPFETLTSTMTSVDDFFSLNEGKENGTSVPQERLDHSEVNPLSHETDSFLNTEQFFTSFDKMFDDLNEKKAQGDASHMPEGMLTGSNIFKEEDRKLSIDTKPVEISPNFDSIFQMDSW